MAYCADICGVTADKHNGIINLIHIGNSAFQYAMYRAFARYGTAGRNRRAILINRHFGGIRHTRIARQTQIIIAGVVNIFLPANFCRCPRNTLMQFKKWIVYPHARRAVVDDAQLLIARMQMETVILLGCAISLTGFG